MKFTRFTLSDDRRRLDFSWSFIWAARGWPKICRSLWLWAGWLLRFISSTLLHTMCSKLFNLSFLLTQILTITMKSKFQCLQSRQTQSTLSAMLSATYQLMTTPGLCTGVLNYYNATSSHPPNTDFTPFAHDKQLHLCKYVQYMYAYKYYMYVHMYCITYWVCGLSSHPCKTLKEPQKKILKELRMQTQP